MSIAALKFYNQRKVVEHGRLLGGQFTAQQPEGLASDELLVAIVAKNELAESMGVTRIARAGLASAIDVSRIEEYQQVLLDYRAGRWTDVALFAVKVEDVRGTADELIPWIELGIRIPAS